MTRIAAQNIYTGYVDMSMMGYIDVRDMIRREEDERKSLAKNHCGSTTASLPNQSSVMKSLS